MAERRPVFSPLVPPPGWLAPEEARRERRLQAMFMLLVTMLALVLRLHDLGRQPLWIDEFLSWQHVRPGLSFWEQVRDAFQGPLFHALLWPLARVESLELAMRLPSALAGAAAVPLLGALAGQLYGTACGRAAALLLALSPFHVWYSQEARGYSLAITFGIAASLVLLRMMRAGATRGRAAGYGLLSTLAVLSHQSALLLWAGHAAAVAVVARPRGRERAVWTAALLVAPLVFSPWLLMASGILAVDRLVPGAALGEALRGETTVGWLSLPFAAHTLLFGYSLGPSLRELHGPERLAAVKAALPLLLAAAAVAGAAIVVGLARLRRGWELLLWIAVPAGLVLLLAWRNVKPFNPRYLATAAPWLLVLAARGITVLPRRWGAALGVALAGFFLLAVGNHFQSPRYWKEDVRSAAAVAAAGGEAGEPVLAPAVGSLIRFYYEGPGEVVPCDWPVLETPEAALAAMEQSAAGRDCGWLVLVRRWKVDPRGLLVQTLEREGWLSSTVELPGASVLRWCRPAAEGGTDGPAPGAAGAL